MSPPEPPGRPGGGDPVGRRARNRTGRPEPVGVVLRELAGTRPWRAGMSLGRLGRRWVDVVGDRLALECTPLRLEGSVLLVRASSAAWASQVRFLANEVARKANAVLGTEAIRTVKVVV